MRKRRRPPNPFFILCLHQMRFDSGFCCLHVG
jgi:hypothetical protein